MDGAASATPKQRIAAECARPGGGPALIAACAALLSGRPDDVDDRLITVLGGGAAGEVLDGAAGGRSGYWPRVWAARGLLHAWADPGTEAACTTEAHNVAGSDHAAGSDRIAGSDRPAVTDRIAGSDRIAVADRPAEADRPAVADRPAEADAATIAIIGALADDAWRVREMAAKVVARHRIGGALDVVAPLRDDPIPRVRAAAHRAVVFLTASTA